MTVVQNLHMLYSALFAQKYSIHLISSVALVSEYALMVGSDVVRNVTLASTLIRRNVSIDEQDCNKIECLNA